MFSFLHISTKWLLVASDTLEIPKEKTFSYKFSKIYFFVVEDKNFHFSREKAEDRFNNEMLVAI